MDSENDPLLPSADGPDTQQLIGSVEECKRKQFFFKAAIWKIKADMLPHIKFVPRLILPYMVWLFLIFALEYLINQSLYEALYYPDTHIAGFCLSQAMQYKWYQLAYAIGVLLSRSSVLVFRIKFFHVLAVLQMINFALLLSEVVLQFIPVFWITLVLALYVGMLGGAVYANAFYAISMKVPAEHREFSMAVTSVADTTGVAVAAVLSIGVHQYICSLGY